MFVNNELQKAIDYYSEALAIESACTEALYNLGESLAKEEREKGTKRGGIRMLVCRFCFYFCFC